MQFEFQDPSSDNIEEREALFKSLMDTALAGKHTDFELIKNITEWQVIRESKRGLKKVIELFDTLAKEVYENYCEAVVHGTQEFNMLYAITQYKRCAEFYREELCTTEEMTDEYWTYIGAGHFIDQFLIFRDRECWDMYDFRKVNNGTK